MGGFVRKLKKFVHRHENLKKAVLSFWSLVFIIRTMVIFKKIKHNYPFRKYKVLIHAVRAIPTTNLVYFDAVFGHAFRKLGCDVKMLYCDGLLDSCDANTIFFNQKPQCFVCKKLGRFVRNFLNLDCLYYRHYITETEIKKIREEISNLSNEQLLDYQYLDVRVGEHAQASTIRYFLFGKLDLNNPFEVNVLREKLFYAMVEVKIASKIIEKEKPDLLFTLHGIYSTWGPFVEYFRKKGIDTVIYGNQVLRLGHFIFGRNWELNDIVSKNHWNNFSRYPLSAEEKERIDIYFGRRAKNKAKDQDMYVENFNEKIKKDLILKLSKAKYLRRYVLYTNVAWDSAIKGRTSEVFDNVFDWLDTTINFFKNKKDCQLIIKPHPAELVIDKCSKGIVDYIKERHGILPENIIVLQPDVPLSAYDLINSNSIALVYTGTLGLELAVSGVPVIAASHVHYQEAGVVKNIKTLEEYLNLLGNPEEIISFAKANIELAKKYAYFYFFKLPIRIPFYRDDKWSVLDWSVLANIEKLLSDDSNIIKVCKKIINKEDIAAPL